MAPPIPAKFFKYGPVFLFFWQSAAILPDPTPIFLRFLRSCRGCTGIFWGSQRKILRMGRLFVRFLNIVHFDKAGWKVFAGIFVKNRVNIVQIRPFVCRSQEGVSYFLQIWAKMYEICDIFKEK